MAEMEVDPPAEAVELPKNFSLKVLEIVRSAQGLHGLKHSEYLRYRWVGPHHAPRCPAPPRLTDRPGPIITAGNTALAACAASTRA